MLVARLLLLMGGGWGGRKIAGAGVGWQMAFFFCMNTCQSFAGCYCIHVLLSAWLANDPSIVHVVYIHIT